MQQSVDCTTPYPTLLHKISSSCVTIRSLTDQLCCTVHTLNWFWKSESIWIYTGQRSSRFWDCNSHSWDPLFDLRWWLI